MEEAIDHVLRLPPSAGNPRNSEGDFIELEGGRWLFIYTHFDGGDGDHAAAHLAGRISDDDGVTWSHEDQLVLPNEGDMNVMSVSLLRLQDGRIAMLYLRKNSLADCRPYLRMSDDEAASWGEPIEVIPTDDVGYYVVNNDRMIQLPSGRLLIPTALHSGEGLGASADLYSPYGQIYCYLSDDAGLTWRRSPRVLVDRPSDKDPAIMQEPGVVALSDGRLMMFCRTDAGSQFVAYSGDEGETWSPLRASDIVSPLSPASIERILKTGDLLLVWNNHADIPEALAGRRTPLTTAISQDEGTTWTHVRTLEDNPNGWYCYTGIAFQDDHVLLAYAAGDRRENNGLATLQLTRVPVAWLYGD